MQVVDAAVEIATEKYYVCDQILREPEMFEV